MPRLIWSPAALRDVQRLYRFLAQDNKRAATRAIKAIRTGANILARQPQVGRPVEEMDPEFRQWPVNFGASGYMVLYHFDGQDAVILAVRHQKEAGY